MDQEGRRGVNLIEFIEERLTEDEAMAWDAAKQVAERRMPPALVAEDARKSILPAGGFTGPVLPGPADW